MSVKIGKFLRKPFSVEAVQVTPENMEEVAKWCNGFVLHDGEKEGHLSRDYIKVNVKFPRDDTQTKAYLGNWVLKSGKAPYASFKVYDDKAFRKAFETVEEASERKYTMAEVFEAMQNVMKKA